MKHIAGNPSLPPPLPPTIKLDPFHAPDDFNPVLSLKYGLGINCFRIKFSILSIIIYVIFSFLENAVIPVAGSVIAVHIVIGIYVWMAMKEGDGVETEPIKED